MDLKNLNVIFEDETVIVCYKEPGIPSQTNKVGQMDMVALVANYRSRNGQEAYVGLVHRLDQAVEGVMVFGKTKEATANLSKQSQERTMTKQYYAIVGKHPVPDKALLTDYLLRDGRNNVSAVVKEGTKGAKKAQLEYEVIKEHPKGTLLRVTLYTGRHHQIRVQLSHAGYPIVGDRKYGQMQENEGYRPLSLGAYRLCFQHPKTGEYMEFDCQDMMKMLQ